MLLIKQLLEGRLRGTCLIVERTFSRKQKGKFVFKFEESESLYVFSWSEKLISTRRINQGSYEV